jgi:hypothetical protein
MATDEVWENLIAWLKTFPGSVDPEKYIRLVHNNGALCPSSPPPYSS